MIKRLKYNEIDFAKYSKCIENACQRKYSATKDFLDITAGKNWELLVYNNYEAVMPVCCFSKLGLKMVYNPKLCQQLGVFSQEDSVAVNDLFFEFLNKNYWVRYYGFNDINSFSKPLQKRKNFLMMPGSYDEIYQKYSPKRKRKLRQEPEIKEHSEIRYHLDLNKVEEFILKNMRGADHHPSDHLEFMKIFRQFYEKQRLELVGYYYHGRLTNVIALYADELTVALLGTYNDAEFVKISGASVLIDDAIRKNIQHKIFDFEGGDIPNIEEFFRGFRPEMKPYPCYGNSKKELVKKLFRLKDSAN